MLLKVDLVKLYFGDFPQEDREMTWYFEDQHPLSQDQLTREDSSPSIGAESSPAPIDSEEAIISEIESQEKKEEETGVTIYCATHLDEKEEYWCEEDSVLVCKKCIIFGEHKGHLVVYLEEKRLTGSSYVLYYMLSCLLGHLLM